VSGRRALVPGGLGFIGSNLSARLAGLGATVTVLTPSVAAHRELAAHLSSLGIAIVEGDIRDAAVMRKLVANQDVVFNLAGQSGAVRSIEDPFGDLDVNYRGTLVLLEAVRHVNPAARIVFAGSRLHCRCRRAPPPIRCRRTRSTRARPSRSCRCTRSSSACRP
jgi:nucleoside-diphosphate-sugar epimerase